MRRILLVAAALLLPFLAAAPAAHAATYEICGNNGSGYCMNAWNGGPGVKMYYGGYTNDDFYTHYVYLCSGSDQVQSTAHGDATNCPFSNSILDKDFIQPYDSGSRPDGNNGQCIGTSSSGYGSSERAETPPLEAEPLTAHSMCSTTRVAAGMP